jgi:hypothetical protein
MAFLPAALLIDISKTPGERGHSDQETASDRYIAKRTAKDERVELSL